MSESFSLWDDLASSEHEGRLASEQQERGLLEAAYDVRRNFGRYLAKASGDEDFEERFSYLEERIAHVVGDRVNPTPQVMAWIKNELNHVATSATDSGNNTKTSGFTKRSDLGEWQWDKESGSFKSSKTSTFKCICGCSVQGVGQHSCSCGDCSKIWNISSVTDSNKTAAAPLYICREVLRRDTVLASTAKNADNFINPLDTTPPNLPQVTIPQGPDPSVLQPSVPDPSSIGTPEAMGTSNSLNTPDANTMPDPVRQVRNSKKADVVDPLHPHSNPVPQAEGYDVPRMFGPAAGDETHDEGWGERVKESQASTLNLIFADFGDDEDTTAPDSDNAAPEQMSSPEAPPALAVPNTSPVPGPIENQPIENQALDVAQQAILDMILREKREDVMGIQDTEQKQDLLEDAYQTLDTVQSIESSENFGPLLARVHRDAFREGYVSGYLDRLSENSYEDRTTDYVGTKPPIPGVSNGLDDVTPGKIDDTTQALRDGIAQELDKDNAGPKEERPLDPAEPFGKNKATASHGR